MLWTRALARVEVHELAHRYGHLSTLIAVA
jgi:hypothetical protein